MIYFMIIASIIVADKILKEYFKSSFQGKHREVRTKGNGFGVRKEAGKQKVKENLFRKKEQNKAELKQKRNNKEKNDWKNIGEFLAAKEGLGYLIIYGSQVFKMDWVMLSIVLLCLIAALLYGVLNRLEKHFRNF